MPMKNPPHPGRSLLRDCIEELNLTIAETAEHLQIEESTLAEVCRCRAPITADLAVRIDMAFGGGADTWLRHADRLRPRPSPQDGLRDQADRTRRLTMPRNNPHHPGETIREDCVEALGLTMAEAAAHLQIEEAALAAVCTCEAPITADLAVRFEQAFGSTADTWLRLKTPTTSPRPADRVSLQIIRRIELLGT